MWIFLEWQRRQNRVRISKYEDSHGYLFRLLFYCRFCSGGCKLLQTIVRLLGNPAPESGSQHHFNKLLRSPYVRVGDLNKLQRGMFLRLKDTVLNTCCVIFPHETFSHSRVVFAVGGKWVIGFVSKRCTVILCMVKGFRNIDHCVFI